MQVTRSLVVAVGEKLLTTLWLLTGLCSAGIGFIFGLSISLFSIRTENFLPQYSGNFLKDLDTQWQKFHNVNVSSQETEQREEVHDVHGDPHDHSDLEGVSGPEREVVFHSKEEEAHQGEDKLAAELAEKVKVLCWVMTGPSNHQAKVRQAFS